MTSILLNMNAHLKTRKLKLTIKDNQPILMELKALDWKNRKKLQASKTVGTAG